MRTSDIQRTLSFVKMEFGSDLHREEIRLRHAVLRAPLGLKFSEDELKAEKDELRYGLVDAGGTLIACVLARDLGGSLVKLRQMAVAEEERGKGTGRELMRNVEDDLKARGFRQIELHARDYAIGFYEKMNYRPVGEIFVEIGIPHIKMVRDI